MARPKSIKNNETMQRTLGTLRVCFWSLLWRIVLGSEQFTEFVILQRHENELMIKKFTGWWVQTIYTIVYKKYGILRCHADSRGNWTYVTKKDVIYCSNVVGLNKTIILLPLLCFFCWKLNPSALIEVTIPAHT